ncbi:dolichyl-phosphate beta-glucosyltransferase [Tilletia horrida]|nr:dolichyl-phosphate beta-glucosyltransferase [Tilletia horrida]
MTATLSLSLPVLLSIPLTLALLSLYPLLVLLSPHTRAALPSEYNYLYTDASRAASGANGKAARDEDADADAPPVRETGKLPHLADAASVQLSVIIPAYNEESRLPGMLTETVEYLETLRAAHLPLASSEAQVKAAASRRAASNGNGNGKAAAWNEDAHVSLADALQAPLTSYEILVVDDGSRDQTVDVALRLGRRLGLARQGKSGSERELRVVKLEKNRGKGGAVRHGVLHSRGALILFADADGATRFSDLGELCVELDRVRTPTGHAAVCGSRAHLVGSEAVVKRSFIRNFLMHSFHLFLSILLRPPSPSRLLLAWRRARASASSQPLAQPEIRDTQCGFKLFSRPTAQHIFPLAHLDRWIFDVELLLLAEMASERTLRAGAGAVKRAPVNALNKKAATNGNANGKAATSKTDADDAHEVLLRLPVPIAEIPVHWAEVSGSKIELLRDSIGMALDLLVLRANYALGRWTRPGVVAVE